MFVRRITIVYSPDRGGRTGPIRDVRRAARSGAPPFTPSRRLREEEELARDRRILLAGGPGAQGTE